MFPHEEGEQGQVGQNQNKRSEVSTLTRRLTRSTAHFVLCWRWEPVRHSVIFHKVLRFTYIAIATSAWFLIGARGQSASLSSSTHTHTHTHTHTECICARRHTQIDSLSLSHTHTHCCEALSPDGTRLIWCQPSLLMFKRFKSGSRASVSLSQTHVSTVSRLVFLPQVLKKKKEKETGSELKTSRVNAAAGSAGCEHSCCSNRLLKTKGTLPDTLQTELMDHRTQ